MNSNDSTQAEQGQLRLILLKTWIRELDIVAQSRFISRSALIRHYIRLQLNKDIESLREQLDVISENQKTLNQIAGYQGKMPKENEKW